MVVVLSNIEDTIVVLVSIDKLILKALHVSLVDGAYKREYTKSTKRNLEAQLLLWLHMKLINDDDRVLLLLFAKQELAVIRIHFFRQSI